MIVLQEADELAYRCAFACQKQCYIWHGKKSSKDLKDKFTKTEIVKYFKDTHNKILNEHYTLEPYIQIEEEYQVNYTLERMIDKLFHIEGKDIQEVKLFLTPSDHSNFRYQVAKLMGPRGDGYKAGRGPKPHWLPYIRDIMVSKYSAEEITGYEADDALGIFADKNTILSHIDKDMNMIPGWHYHHVDGFLYKVDDSLVQFTPHNKPAGLLSFYCQMLCGDSIDNIPGVRNPAKAHHKNKPNFTEGSALEILHACSSEDEMYQTIEKNYYLQHSKNYKEAIAEIADLVWIVRSDRLTGRQYLKSKGFL